MLALAKINAACLAWQEGPIASRLLIPTALIMLGSIIVLGALLFLQGQKSAYILVQERNKILVNEVREQINSIFNNMVDSIRLVEDQWSEGDLESAESALLALRAQLSTYVTGLAIHGHHSDDGTVFVPSLLTSTGNLPEEPRNTEGDPFAKGVYTRFLGFSKYDKIPSIALYVPSINRQRILTAKIEIRPTWMSFDRIQLEQGSVALVYPYDLVLAHRDHELVGKSISEHPLFSGPATPTTSGVATYTRNGIQLEAAWAELGKLFPGWIFVEQDRSEILRPTRHLLSLTIFNTVTVFSVAILLLWGASKGITDPVRELSRAVDEYSNTDGGHIDLPKSNGPSEIRQLAATLQAAFDERNSAVVALNDTLADLQKSHADLIAESERARTYGALYEAVLSGTRQQAGFYSLPDGEIIGRTTAEGLVGYLFRRHPKTPDELLAAANDYFPDEEILIKISDPETSAGNKSVDVIYSAEIELKETTHLVTYLRISSKLRGFIVADMTIQRRLQQQLFQSQKMEVIGNLTGGAAHDFNNILSVIIGNLEMMATLNNTRDWEIYRSDAMDAALRGAGLTRNLLTFARRARLEPTVLDLNDVVSDMQGWAKRSIPENIDLELTLGSDLWSVHADLNMIISALLNLIVNSKDAMPGGGNITISTSNLDVVESLNASVKEDISPGRYVVLAVTDTGCGMPADQIPKIFEPFYTTKEPGKGTGLGLSMVVGFMKQSGGSIVVESECGAGTTFSLYFPALEHSAEMTNFLQLAPEPTSFRRARLLVVEDEPQLLAVTARKLTSVGHNVTTSQTGDEAVQIYLEEQNFDAVITDITMPGTLQGEQLVERLREITPELPAIFLSGYPEKTNVTDEQRHSRELWLRKPFRWNDLLSSIERLLTADTN